MRRRSLALCCAVGSLSIVAACGPSPASVLHGADRTVYAAITAKGAVPTFWNRLANAQHQLVTTNEPARDALESARVEVASGEDLYVVEGVLPDAPLAGERARLENFALVAIPAESDIGARLTTPQLHAERVPLGFTTVARRARSRADAPGIGVPSTLAVDRAFLETKLAEFSGATPTILNGKEVTIAERRSSAGRINARAWLRREYEALGFTVVEQPYGSRGASNVVAERRGRDASRYLVLSAHLDNVGNAGADDDGSGTVSVLAAAQALSATELAYTLRVVAFDEEEAGLVGSAAYAKALDTQTHWDGFVGNVSVEMTGYDGNDDGAFHVIDCNENTSAALSAAVVQVVGRDPLRLHRADACTNRSDHASFWRYDQPSIVISQDFFGGDDNPCYHKACDRVGGVNFDYMTRMATALARATEEFIGHP
jgi:hypothetical protein